MKVSEQQMQDYMDSGEHKLNALLAEYNPPSDWDNPNWLTENRIHNWRNYVSDGLKSEWLNFTGRQKIMLASNFNDMASAEEWD